MNQLLKRFRGQDGVLRTFQLIGVIIFLTFIVLGFNGSSMGLVGNQGSRVILGHDRSIRSDEYLRSTPMSLGLQSNMGLNGQTVLSEKLKTTPGSIFFLTNWEKQLFSNLPTDNYFAAIWWLPFLLVWIFISQLLFYLKVPLPITITTTLLLIGSPGVSWWSFQMLDIIGRFALAICFILSPNFFSKQVLLKWLRIPIAAVTLGSLIYDYQPWVICVGLVMYLPLLLTRSMEKEQNRATFITTAIFILLFLLNLYENYALYRVQAKTLYPGLRVASGGLPNIIQWIASGTLDAQLWHPIYFNATNQSELSIGFGILIIPFLFYFGKVSWAKRGYTYFSSSFLVVLLLWTVIPIPALTWNPFRILPANRAATAWTVMIPFCLALILGEHLNAKAKQGLVLQAGADTKSKLYFAPKRIIALVVALILLSQGIVFLRSMLGPINYPLIFIFSLVTVIGMFFLLVGTQKHLTIGLAIFVLISIAISGPINPIVHGAGTYSDIDLSNQKSIGRQSVWASTNSTMDARLIAEGYPSISGQQVYGPKISMWSQLDPTRKFEKAWNRGASFVTISWLPEGSTTLILNPSADSIAVDIDPCSPSLRLVGLTNILMTHELQNYSCLRDISLKGKNIGLKVYVWIYALSK